MINEKEVIEDFNSISLYLDEGLKSLNELSEEINDCYCEKIFEIKSHIEAIKYFTEKYLEAQDGRA